MDTLLWYWAVSWDYVAQMLPCMLLAALVFFLMRPWRKKRLARQGMASGGLREAALLFFVMFCAGLAALTVFPAYFWTAYHWQEALAGHEVFFPLVPLSKSIQEIQWTPMVLQNLREGGWAGYMAIANLLIFCPVGFFPALLWRGNRCMLGLLTGFCTSFCVEFLQLFVGRATDIDDLILNTLGGCLGGLLCLIFAHLAPRFTRRFQVEVRYGRETGDTEPAPGAGAGEL